MVCSYPYRAGDEPIPGYRLISFLGRGGFGEVWKATAPGGTQCAFKVIKLDAATGRKEFRAMRLVRCIRHANLVPITALWLKDKAGQILDDEWTSKIDLAGSKTAEFFVRETMMVANAGNTGEPDPTELIIAMGLGQISLFDRLRQCQEQGLPGIPDEELLGYMQDVAKAIDFLNKPIHDLGQGNVSIQHCDIKPHNMLLVGGAVQLCDFGLACILGDIRSTKTAAGTIAYAAPEYLREGKPSAASDQYSLAITYYELKTGALPFDSDSFIAVSQAVLDGAVNVSRLPAEQQVVLRRAISLDPKKRYGTTMQMVDALSGVSHTPLMPAPKTRRRFVALLLFALVLAGGGAFAWLNLAPLVIDPHKAALAAAAKGDKQRESGHLAEALPFYNRAIQLDPNWGEAYFKRGDAYLAQGETHRALADFDDALQLDPKLQVARHALAQAHLRRANDLAEQNQLPEAIAELTEILEKNDADDTDIAAKTRLLRGQLALKISDFDAAIADFEQLRTDDPTTYGSLPELGRLLFERGKTRLAQKKYDLSLADFAAAQQIDSKAYGSHAPYAQAYIERGKVRQAAADNTGALADYSTAIEQHPLHADEAYCPRGTLLYAQGDYDKAIADFDKAIQVNPRDALALRERGGCQLDKPEKNFDAAVADLTRALELQPNDPIALDRRGYARLQKTDKDLAGAIADYGEEIRIEPNAGAYVNRGIAQQDSGDLDSAIADFSQALALDPNDSDTFLKRAMAWHESGDLEKAIGDCDRAIRLNEQFMEAYQTRGVYRAQRGDAAGAIQDFGQVIKLAPEDATAYLVRAEAQLSPEIAAYPQALTDLEKATSLDPKLAEPWRLIGWVRATCPVEKLRDGENAVVAATKARDLSSQADASERAHCLDALAAAYAEAKQFAKAVETQSQAVDLASNEYRDEYNARLKLYRESKPYRATP